MPAPDFPIRRRIRKSDAGGKKKTQRTPCCAERAVWPAVSQSTPCGAVCGAVWRRVAPCGAMRRS
eukprot:gene12043-biopygen242